MSETRQQIAASEGRSFLRPLWRAGGASLALKLAATVAAFITSVVLARSLGPSGYGTFSFVMACVALLALPARAGVATLVVRETARAMSTRNWRHILGVWRWSLRVSASMSVIVLICAGAFLYVAKDSLDSSLRTSLAVGLFLVPLVVLIENRSAAIRGLGYSILGQSPELLIRPMTFLILVIFVPMFWGAGDVTAVLIFQFVATLVAAAVAGGALLICRPSEVQRCREPLVEGRKWLRSVFPLSIVVGAQLINTQADILLLGVLAGDAETGIYKVAVQGATVVSLGLVAIGAVTMPLFAGLFAKNDLSTMQSLATKSARLMLFLALPPFLIYLAFGEALLEFVFGPEYISAYLPLVILSFGQVLNAAFGTVGPILNMVGRERETATWISVAAMLNIGLNLSLIPTFGSTGAAIATAFSLLLWNALLWRAARRSLGINSSAF